MQNKDEQQSFPGYPHYPAGADITTPGNNNGQVSINEDETSENNKTDHLNDREADTAFVSGTDADVTEEDLKLLDAAEENMDTTDSNNQQHATLDSVDNDGDQLNEEGTLDVPGSEDDDSDELIGEEDEENNYYSLGGDLHESQEENKGE